MAAGLAIGCGVLVIGCGGDREEACSAAQLECVPGEQVKFEVTPFSINPGEERTRCLFFDWPEDAYIHEILNSDSPTLHHLVLFQIDDSLAMPSGTEIDCEGFLEEHAEIFQGMIYGAGGQRSPVKFPSGDYGIFVGKGRKMMADVHYLNYGETPRMVSAPLTLKYASVEPKKLVGMMLLDNLDLSIPPNSNATCPSDPSSCYVAQDMSDELPASGEVFWASFHYHARGVLGEGAIVRSSGGATENFITERSAKEPVWNTYDPPLVLNKHDKLMWRCYYNNTEGRVIGYSNSDSKQEMCTLSLYVAF